MKHLLIILISILLLSSPVIGDNHKGETLYLWETSSGEVWKGFGDEETHPKYKGDVKNGKPHGLGLIIFPDGKFAGGKYVGEWKDGKRHGQGKHTSTNGTKYVGEWKEGKYDGQGTYTTNKGDPCVGEWKDDFLFNGSCYEKDGSISIKYVNGEQLCLQCTKWGVLYMGSRNGVMDYYAEKWEGVETIDNKDFGKYEGEIKSGKAVGKGTITYSDGQKYVISERKNGKIWNGIWYDKNGNISWKMVNGKEIKP